MGDREVALGNRALLEELGLDAGDLQERVEALRAEGRTVMFVAVDGGVAGFVAVADPIKSSTPEAIRLLHETARRGEFATGIIYIEPDKDDFIDTLNLVDTPLAALPQDKVRPGKAVLDELMESLR